ncbi:hypothetical protein K458DRAFT_26620 [Lentithecium fluviatile CBS 122367]|uniref:Uncharacterized protein n=1 Tax=Lentithecium fluviatile CBS 122367 TaxID=1168545 RepID=A0A6G1J2M4_9PLEO|nr:hypothetical protein K458DRAFT_26620 [Lentithecium fluviatile CBS 122367]
MLRRCADAAPGPKSCRSALLISGAAQVRCASSQTGSSLLKCRNRRLLIRTAVDPLTVGCRPACAVLTPLWSTTTGKHGGL